MKKAFVIIFGILFIAFCVYNALLPSEEFLENENRFSSVLPEFSKESLISGEFTNGYEKYITDKFAFRDFFVYSKSNLEKLSGKKENNGVYFAKDDYLIDVFENRDYSEVLEANISAINKLAENKSLSVSFALIPTAYEVLKDKLPPYAYHPYQQNVLKETEEKLKNVNFINPYNILNENNQEYIYYRTDHHQTAHGSYLVYKDIMNKTGKTFFSEENFNIHSVSDEFYGTTWSKTPLSTKGDSIIKYEPLFDVGYDVMYDLTESSDSLYNEKNIADKDKYTYYLDGNHGITTIKVKLGKQNEKQGKKLAVIKDSYAHSIIPFLANHYDEITVFDLRYYNFSVPGYIEENGIDEVLFIYNVDNFTEDNNLNKISVYLKNKQ